MKDTHFHKYEYNPKGHERSHNARLANSFQLIYSLIEVGTLLCYGD